MEEKFQAVLRILAGERIEGVAEELGVSAPRVARWHSIFLAGGRDAIARSEMESSHHTPGFFTKHRSAIFQWSVVTLVLLIVLATVTHIVATGLP